MKLLLEDKDNNDKNTENNLALIRAKFIETFNILVQRSETIWQQEHNEFNSNALYPLGGQLDHIFVLANQDIITAEETATIQLMDMQGNMLASNKDAIVEHMQNSLVNNTPAFATDHQGLVSSIRVTDRNL